MSKRQTGEHVAIDGDKRRRRRKGGLRVPSDNVPRPGDGEIATPQPEDPRLAVSVAYTFTSDGSRGDNGRVRAREPGFEDEDLNTNPEAPVVTEDASDLDVDVSPLDDEDGEELSDDDLDADDELEADGEEELDDDDLEDDDDDDQGDAGSPFERESSEYSVPVDEMSDEDLAAMGVDPVDITETESAEFDSPDPAEGARAAGKSRRAGENGRTEEIAAASGGEADDSTVIEESEERYPVSVGAALPVAEPADDSDLARTMISRPRAGSQPDARSLAPVATLDIDEFDDEEEDRASGRPPTGDENTGDSVDIAFDEEDEGRFQVGAAAPVTLPTTPPEMEAALERARAEDPDRDAFAAEEARVRAEAERKRDADDAAPAQRVPPAARFQRAATMELSLVDLEEIAESAESERDRDNSQITEAPVRREPASPPTPGVPSVVASLEEKLDAAARTTVPMAIEPGDASDSGELLTDDLLEELDDGAAVKARTEPEQEVELTGEEEEVVEMPRLDGSGSAAASAAPVAAAAAPSTAEPHPPPPPRASKGGPPPAPQRSAGVPASGQVTASVAASAAVAAAVITSSSASPASAVSTSKARKRGRPWFDEVFDEDYLRTLPFLTPGATQAEAQFVMESLGVEPGGQILDIGCGYGRHAMELAARGYHVVGLDSSLPLLLRGADEAQRRGLTINFIHGDMRDLNFDSQFDGAYCLFSTFGYFDDETNKKTAQHIARALRPGARCVFEVLNRDYLIADLPSRVWWEGDGCVVLEEVQFNYFSSRIISNRSIVFDDGRQIEQEISLRCFSLHELGKLLHAAGFRVLEISGSMTTRGRFFGAQSRDIVVVAERRAKKDDRPDNGS